MPRIVSTWPRPTAIWLLAAVFLSILLPSTLAAALTPPDRTAHAAPYNYGFDVNEHAIRHSLSQRSSSADPYVVQGISVADGESMPVRQEIRNMEADKDLWTLYLLGLSLMQYTDQANLLSYYQIAGIHGVPWIEWNGVAAVPGSENTGYCTHISELFLTWHRPYLALYEQVLYSLIQFIASLYNDTATRHRYQAAAARFRIPYMDWAAQPPAGQSVLPESVGGSSTVLVSGPNGVQLISNPLYSYLFKPLNATMFLEDPYDLWLGTVRAPTAQDATAGSNNTQISRALDQNFQSIQQRLYNLFSNYQNFSTFSNEAWIPNSSSGGFDSLESLHDTLHSLMGLQGHMSWIPFSAFDPIFFLHHCMVDRAFALWQILNPDSWVVPTIATSSSFTTSAGQTQDARTPLTPFYKDANGAFWTSDDIRDMGVFGYTYDDMVEFPRSSLWVANATTQSLAKNRINALYGSSSPAVLRTVEGSKHGKGNKGKKKGPKANGRRSNPEEGAPTHPSALAEPSQPPASVLVNNQYHEWVANIHCEKQTLSGTFFIHLFLGDMPSDPSTWSYASNLVGSISVFSSPAGALSGIIGGGAGAYSGHTSGTVPLTSAMAQVVARGQLASLDPSVAEPYLRRKLHAGAIMTDGTVIPLNEVNGLGITIASSCVEAPASADELPRWGQVEDEFDLI